MTSISTILKFWVISVAILQTTGRRGKAKKKHPKRQSSPIRAVQCPTKCHRFIDKYDNQLVREVKPGQFLVETRVATHCDTDCLEDCLKTQDPQNTQVISYTCAAKSSVCDYRENKECEKHVFNSDGEPLPWPYVEDDKAEEEQVEPEISEYSDDNCPVCMDSDLSDKMIGCMKNRYKTESCVAGDSCWVYDLSGSLSVNLLNGKQIVLDRVIKCQRNTLPHQGCSNEKCTGNFRKVHEEIGRSNNEVYTTTPIQRVETIKVTTTQPATEPAISTEPEKDENPATESQDDSIEKFSTGFIEIVTLKPPSTVNSKEEISVKHATESESNEDQITDKPTTKSNEETTVKHTTAANEEITVKQTTAANEEITVKQTTAANEEITVKQTTAANEEITVKQTTEPKLESVANLTTADETAENPTTEPEQDTETTDVRYTTESNSDEEAPEKSHVSFGTTTQSDPGPDDIKMNPDEDDNLTVDDRGVEDSDTTVVCSNEVQNCPGGQDCYGRKMDNGNIDFVCSEQAPDCNGDDGCVGTCSPLYDPCVAAVSSSTSTTVPAESGDVTEKPQPEDNLSESSGDNETNSAESLPKGDGLESNETETESNEIDPNDDKGKILDPIVEDQVSNTKVSKSKGESAKFSAVSLWLIAFFLFLRHQA